MVKEFSIVIEPQADREPVRFTSHSVATSLVVAGMNLDHGDAELREGERRLATLRKCGNDRSPFWLINPD